MSFSFVTLISQGDLVEFTPSLICWCVKSSSLLTDLYIVLWKQKVSIARCQWSFAQLEGILLHPTWVILLVLLMIDVFFCWIEEKLEKVSLTFQSCFFAVQIWLYDNVWVYIKLMNLGSVHKRRPSKSSVWWIS